VAHDRRDSYLNPSTFFDPARHPRGGSKRTAASGRGKYSYTSVGTKYMVFKILNIDAIDKNNFNVYMIMPPANTPRSEIDTMIKSVIDPIYAIHQVQFKQSPTGGFAIKF
jgi:hypothetical protein